MHCIYQNPTLAVGLVAILSWIGPPPMGDPIKLNGEFLTLCAILCFVVVSPAEAKLSALFLNCKEGMIFRPTLEELGHPQPKSPIHCNNTTAVIIVNNTVKQQRACPMEMQYF